MYSTLADVPEGAPKVTLESGIQNQNITIGQKLRLNCTSPFGAPPPHLSWRINQQLVNTSWVQNYPLRYRQNLAQSSSSLQFPASEGFLQHGRTIVVTCVAKPQTPNHVENGEEVQRQTHVTFTAKKQESSFWERMFSR
ncbi:hypothetical protein SK128_007737, partial [Halocaridina rubra]